MAFITLWSRSIAPTSMSLVESTFLILFWPSKFLRLSVDFLLESRSFLDRRFFFGIVASCSSSSSLARSILWRLAVGHFLWLREWQLNVPGSSTVDYVLIDFWLSSRLRDLRTLSLFGVFYRSLPNLSFTIDEPNATGLAKSGRESSFCCTLSTCTSSTT